MKTKFYAGFGVTLFGALVLICAAIANGPDRTLTFERVIPSRESPETLALQLSDVQLWPQWFHSLERVETISGSGLTPGAELKLAIAPKGGLSKRFDVIVKVLKHEPGKSLELQVLDDSTGKLPQLFSRLTWKVEVKPGAKAASQIEGTEIGQTANWRSRLFGVIAERILMHQVFYPDLIRLSEINQSEAEGSRSLFSGK